MSGKFRTRNWCFTAYTHEDVDHESYFNPEFVDWGATCPETRYIIMGLETCPKTGRLHWQGYIELRNPATLVSAKNALDCNHAHLEARRGTRPQAIAYCYKLDSAVFVSDEEGSTEGKVIFSWGDDSPQGIDDIYDEVLGQCDLQQAIELVKKHRPRDYCLYGAQIRGNLERHLHKDPDFKRGTRQYNLPFFSRETLASQVVFINGPAGAGKTRWAMDHFEKPLLVRNRNQLKRLSGSNHDGIVFDDMNVDVWHTEELIAMTDAELPSAVDVKHGHVELPAGMPRIITHNKKFWEWLPANINQEQRNALKRRVIRINLIKKLF